jgi:uncharacterized integral membrane protein (TIGR00698 family)
VLGTVFCISPWSSSATALLLGIVLSIFIGNPFTDTTKAISQKLLAYSIIGLGAGMNLITVGQAGLSGLSYTIISISLTLILGIILGKIMKSDGETSVLISVGTAICGGSAIAAVAPAIKAKSQSITVALGTVFLLNAVALMIFPFIGHYFILTQEQFGLWSALAIHDTSSVVGAGLQYGPEALKIGTTVKLARALWIVPLTFLISYLNRKKTSQDTANTKKPWFILGFLIMAAIFTWLPQLKNLGHYIELVARKGFILTLFFIGTNLSWQTLKSVGLRPLAQGLILWLIVSILALFFVKYLEYFSY